MTASTTTDNKLTVDFVWKGPNRIQEGEVQVIHLKFKEAKSEISVHLPEEMSPGKVRSLPFTLLRYREGTERTLSDGRIVRELQSETHPDSLRVTSDQIANLTLQLDVLGSSTGKKRSVDQSEDQDVTLTSRSVNLEMPGELEMGKKYSIVISARELSLSARFVKVVLEEPEMISGKKDLAKVLSNLLMPWIASNVVAFGIKVKELPDQALEGLTVIRPPTEQEIGKITIEKELNRIDPEILKPLLDRIRSSQAECQGKNLLEQAALQKPMFKECFETIGAQGFKRIMRANLEPFVPGKPRSQQIEALITLMAEQFVAYCKDPDPLTTYHPKAYRCGQSGYRPQRGGNRQMRWQDKNTGVRYMPVVYSVWTSALFPVIFLAEFVVRAS